MYTFKIIVYFFFWVSSSDEGYLDKVHKSLFNVGIIITVVNIIYQLQNLWETVPFWLYLLIVGLGLIIFVTYKETKKIDNKKDN